MHRHGLLRHRHGFRRHRDGFRRPCRRKRCRLGRHHPLFHGRRCPNLYQNSRRGIRHVRIYRFFGSEGCLKGADDHQSCRLSRPGSSH